MRQCSPPVYARGPLATVRSSQALSSRACTRIPQAKYHNRAMPTNALFEPATTIGSPQLLLDRFVSAAPTIPERLLHGDAAARDGVSELRIPPQGFVEAKIQQGFDWIAL